MKRLPLRKMQVALHLPQTGFQAAKLCKVWLAVARRYRTIFGGIAAKLVRENFKGGCPSKFPFTTSLSTEPIVENTSRLTVLHI